MSPSPLSSLVPDASELILCDTTSLVCETYIFEPSRTEQTLGYLFAVAEVEHRDGVGNDLLEVVMSAIQQEYYRDPLRGALASFESSLHQANLVLHDSNNQGVRDWMEHFHVAVAVLAGTVLHVSVAGEAIVLLQRKSHVTNISYGLSQIPLTNPLRTFSQVASGTLVASDIVFFGTAAFDRVFSEADLHLACRHQSAVAITTNLQQLYRERSLKTPVAVLTVAVNTASAATPSEDGRVARQPLSAAPYIPKPRPPLLVRQSKIGAVAATSGRVVKAGWRFGKLSLWPRVRGAAATLGQGVGRASSATSQHVQSRLQRWRSPDDQSPRPAYTPAVLKGLSSLRHPLPTLRSLPVRIWTTFRHWMSAMPWLSRIFIGLTVVLSVALIVSLVLLQNKRQSDAAIQRASELLQEGRTKVQAAQTALIYNNREQAQSLLHDATQITHELAATNLYTQEVSELSQEIQSHSDRVQRISRVEGAATQTVGSFAQALGDHLPPGLYSIGDTLYTFDAANNTVYAMTAEGTVENITTSSQGIGFLQQGIAHDTDPLIIFVTSQPGIALFDVTAKSFRNQDIDLPASDALKLTAFAPYGNRLYVYDSTTHNIYSYTQSLRGYASKQAWLKDTTQLPAHVISLAIDGSLYTLHEDGLIKKFHKNEAADFTVEAIEPALTGATRLITSEDFVNLYVFDPEQDRVVIFNKKGQLVKQVYVTPQTGLVDMAISADEKTLFVLDGPRVVKVSLAE